MTHLDTSFLVDLLREAARGEEGPAHAALDRLAEEELAVVCTLPVSSTRVRSWRTIRK